MPMFLRSWDSAAWIRRSADVVVMVVVILNHRGVRIRSIITSDFVFFGALIWKGLFKVAFWCVFT